MLIVSDNGKGITERQIADPRSLGLIGMRERVFPWAGQVRIKGMQDRGTTVIVRVPLAKTKRLP
jgi:signal transduction histidine kinase